MNSGKIFVIDDERTIRLTFRLALETDGYEVTEAASAAEAMAGFRKQAFALAILDLRLGEQSGLQTLAAMRAENFRTPTLMITAYGSIRDAVQAMRLGAIDFLEKPIEPVALRAVVAEILGRHRAPSQPNGLGSLDDFLRETKRLINLQSFDLANGMIGEALRFYDQSPDVHNLQGVLHEIANDYVAARKSYGRAIKLDSRHPGAQANMRRLFELFNFGSSQEALHLGEEPCVPPKPPVGNR